METTICCNNLKNIRWYFEWDAAEPDWKVRGWLGKDLVTVRIPNWEPYAHY